MGYPQIAIVAVAMIGGTILGRIGMQNLRWGSGLRQQGLGAALMAVGFALMMAGALEPLLRFV